METFIHPALLLSRCRLWLVLLHVEWDRVLGLLHREERSVVKPVIVKTLPKAQRTRGLSSAYQSNFFRSFHKFKDKSRSNLAISCCQLWLLLYVGASFDSSYKLSTALTALASFDGSYKLSLALIPVINYCQRWQLLQAVGSHTSTSLQRWNLYMPLVPAAV